jgi:predicted O-linked N-acetylglucosamine transferase (SPINDLY family)
VLTLAGPTFVARVAGSLLRALDLSELITTNLQDYQDLAVRLAQDAPLLANLRTRLAANRQTSALFDAGQFARHLERAYATMWEMHAAGEAPRGFAVSAPPLERCQADQGRRA